MKTPLVIPGVPGLGEYTCAVQVCIEACLKRMYPVVEHSLQAHDLVTFGSYPSKVSAPVSHQKGFSQLASWRGE